MTEFATKPWLSAYAPGVPREIPPVTATLVDMMAESVREYDSRIALEFFGASMSYRQLGEKIERVAGGLRTLGVGHGDRVALVLPNCPQHVIAFYAILSLGAIVVEHNPLYTEGELRRQFEDHGATVAIVWDKVVATVQNFPAAMGVATVISVDLTKAMPLVKQLALRLPLAKAKSTRAALSTNAIVNGAIAWSSLSQIASGKTELPAVNLDDIAILQYTSGTTGAPKGAILTHANLRANAMQGEAWVPGLRKGHEVVYAVLPMFHSYGLTLCVTFAMSMGARLVLFPKFDTNLVLGAMKHIPATFLPAVPPIYQRLAKAAAARKISLQGIRFAISGAMSLPVETVKVWERATGGLLVEGYGTPTIRRWTSAWVRRANFWCAVRRCFRVIGTAPSTPPMRSSMMVGCVPATLCASPPTVSSRSSTGSRRSSLPEASTSHPPRWRTRCGRIRMSQTPPWSASRATVARTSWPLSSPRPASHSTGKACARIAAASSPHTRCPSGSFKLTRCRTR